MILRSHQSPVRGMAPAEAASHWLIQLEEGGGDPRVRAEFDTWHAETPDNAAAFARAQSAWQLFDHADGDPHLTALRESALASGPEPRRGLWLAAGAAIAATLLAVMAFNMQILLPLFDRATHSSVASRPEAALAVARPDRGGFATARGERRTIELADGTVMTLNTDSAVRVAYTPGRRLVRVTRGQVLFEVAKNYRRPFVVQAADRQVTALGTVFEVRLDRNRMKVTLVEGKVVVDAISDRPANAGVVVPTVLTPGEEFVAAIGAASQTARVDVDQQLRWRQGFVEFDDVPLSTAVDEMNRYSSRQLVIQDAATGHLRVSGVFRIGNPERFAAIVGELLPIQTRPLGEDRIELRAAQ